MTSFYNPVTQEWEHDSPIQAAQNSNFDTTGLDKQWSTAPTFNSDSTDASGGIQSGWSKSLGDGKTQQYGMGGEDLGISQDKSTWDSIKPILAIAGLAATGGALSGAGAFGGAGAAGALEGGAIGSASMPTGAFLGEAPFSLVPAGANTAASAILGAPMTSAAEQSVMEQLASQFGKQFTMDSLGQNALKQAAMQLAVNGKIDLGKIALGTMVAPIGATAGGMATDALGLDPGALKNILSGAVSGGTNAGLTGGDIGRGALVGGVGSVVLPSLTKTTGSIWDDAKKVFGSQGVDSGKGIGGWTSDNGAIEDAYVPTENYNLNPDYELSGIRNNVGFNADINPTVNAGLSPVDYSIADTSTSDLGFQLPTYPDLTAMGGGQGLTTETMEGTVGALGLAPDGSSIVLGDPNSFINNPTILGNTVIGTDTLLNPDGSGTTPKDKEKSKDLASQYRFSFNNGQSKKREFGDIPIPELMRMGFDPALIALLKGAQNG